MKKFRLIALILCLIAFPGLKGLCNSEVTVFNLKINNLYLLDIDGKSEDIQVSNEDIIKIEPLTLISNNSHQLVIDTYNTGICDVGIKTENKNYKIRFIIGSIFDEETDKLTRIDMPSVFNGEGK